MNDFFFFLFVNYDLLLLWLIDLFDTDLLYLFSNDLRRRSLFPILFLLKRCRRTRQYIYLGLLFLALFLFNTALRSTSGGNHRLLRFFLSIFIFLLPLLGVLREAAHFVRKSLCIINLYYLNNDLNHYKTVVCLLLITNLNLQNLGFVQKL